MRATRRSAFVSQRFIAGPAKALALAAALIGSVPVFAQTPAEDERPATWGVGIGVGSKQKPYAGIDRDYQALPLIEFDNKYVHWLGPAVEVKLPSVVISDTQRINIRLVGRYSIFGGYEADDAPILAGMSERKDGFWAGGKVEWKNRVANVSALWTHDVSGYSKGQRFTLGVDRNWRIGQNLMLTPRLAAIVQDDKYNDYYYGVRASEARPGRAAHRGESGVNAEVGLRSVYRMDRHHSVLFDASVTSLASEIKNSPIVGRSSENRFLLAYIYRF